MLGWLNDTGPTTVEAMEGYLASEYDIMPSSATVYMRIPPVLDLIRRSRDGSIELTGFGIALLHASDQQIRDILTVLLMEKYEGFSHILRLIVESPKPIPLEKIVSRCETDFPRWTSASNHRERLLWQRSLLLIETVGSSETFRATPQGVATVLEQAESSEPQNPFPTEAQWLGQRLVNASTDGENSEKFEMLVKQAFEILGFQAKHIGGRGNTDVLVESKQSNFRAIVDSKARADRLNQFDVFTIDEHLQAQKASRAMLVAPGFGGGRVIRQAESHKITLLPVYVLCEWLLWHEQTPFSVAENVKMFDQIGLIEDMPDLFATRRHYQQHMAQLLTDVFVLLEGFSATQAGIQWTKHSLHSALIVKSNQSYSVQDVQAALALLVHPTISAITVNETGVFELNMTWQNFADRLSSFTRLLTDRQS
jgi:hypothetical protein